MSTYYTPNIPTTSTSMSTYYTPNIPTTTTSSSGFAISNNTNPSNDIANVSNIPNVGIVATRNVNTIISIKLIEDVSVIRYFQTHNTNGTPRSYKTNDVVYYRNRFFVAVKNTTREPFSISTEWKEIFDVPVRYDISETEPKGLKRPGDRWESTITSLVYTYIKNDNLYNQYVWVSD